MHYEIKVQRRAHGLSGPYWFGTISVIEPGMSVATAELTISRVNLGEVMHEIQEWITEHNKLENWLKAQTGE